MQKIYSYLVIIILITSTACSKEKTADPATLAYGPLYTFDNTPLGKRLEAVFKRTGTYVLYQNILPKDWTWNFNKNSGTFWTANGVSEPETNMPLVLDYLETYWFSLYSNKFLNNYLPLRIIVSDSLLNSTQRQQYQKGEGMQAISIRLVNTASTPVTTHLSQWTETQKKTIAKNLHQNFYLETIATKLSTVLPEEFYTNSTYDYIVDNNSPAKRNPKELGFWNFATQTTNAISPSKIVDVLDWLKNIAATKPENIEALFYYTSGGISRLSEPMKNKYRVLQEYMQTTYGMSFHQLNQIYL